MASHRMGREIGKPCKKGEDSKVYLAIYSGGIG
jgi:hypothetical protein